MVKIMAKKRSGMRGVDKVLKNLAREADKIVQGTGRSAVKGALFIRGESQKKTPIRLGNLRNSAFVVSSGADPAGGAGGGFKGDDAAKMDARHRGDKLFVKAEVVRVNRGGLIPSAGVGYSAAYALSVHENPRAGSGGATAADTAKRKTTNIPLSTIHSKKGQWKYLEDTLKTNERKLLGFIAEGGRID